MCARPKGSKNKPKVSPLVEEKLEKALDKAREEYGIKKPTIEEVVGSMEFVTPEINEKFIEKYGNKVVDEMGQTEKMKLSKDWDTMGKIERLKYLTANRR